MATHFDEPWYNRHPLFRNYPTYLHEILVHNSVGGLAKSWYGDWFCRPLLPEVGDCKSQRSTLFTNFFNKIKDCMHTGSCNSGAVAYLFHGDANISHSNEWSQKSLNTMCYDKIVHLLCFCSGVSARLAQALCIGAEKPLTEMLLYQTLYYLKGKGTCQ